MNCSSGIFKFRTFYVQISLSILENMHANHSLAIPLLTFYQLYHFMMLATGNGLDGSEIKSRWGRDFPHQCILALRPTQPPDHVR